MDSSNDQNRCAGGTLLGGYDEPTTLSYQITLFGPIGADVRHYAVTLAIF